MKLWIISDFVMEEREKIDDYEWGGVSFVIEKFILTENGRSVLDEIHVKLTKEELRKRFELISKQK